MYKIRYFEFHNLLNVFVDICEDSFVPINPVDIRLNIPLHCDLSGLSA